MNTIGIDCRFAGLKAGLGRYTREITKSLLDRNDAIRYVLFVRDAEEDWIKDFTKAHAILSAPFPHYSFSEQKYFPEIIKNADIDLLFAPHFNVPFRCPVPYVVTIHDLILHRYPNQASIFKRLMYHAVIKKALDKASQIIAVSQFVYDDVLNSYGSIVEDKMTAVLEGVDTSFQPVSIENQLAVQKKHGIQGLYFLYVGNAKEHKNVQMLIDAFEKARTQHTLVLLTGGPEVSRLRMGEDVQILSSIDDNDLPALYSGATAFVTASLYEGFGLPVLEAEACGCPVIATNGSAIAEVAGPNALLCEPTIDAFAEAFAQPPGSHTKRELPRWSDVAEQTVQVLQSSL